MEALTRGQELQIQLGYRTYLSAVEQDRLRGKDDTESIRWDQAIQFIERTTNASAEVICTYFEQRRRTD